MELGELILVDVQVSVDGGKAPDEEVTVNVFPGAIFECVRCGSRFSGEELAKLPELTCGTCGYKIFRKVRSQTTKTLKAE